MTTAETETSRDWVKGSGAGRDVRCATKQPGLRRPTAEPTSDQAEVTRR